MCILYTFSTREFPHGKLGPIVHEKRAALPRSMNFLWLKPNVLYHNRKGDPAHALETCYDTLLTPVLSTTLWCLLEASWSFLETSGTLVAKPNTFRRHFKALQSLDCDGMSMDTLCASECMIWTCAQYWCYAAVPQARPDHPTNHTVISKSFSSCLSASIIHC